MASGSCLVLFVGGIHSLGSGVRGCRAVFSQSVAVDSPRMDDGRSEAGLGLVVIGVTRLEFRGEMPACLVGAARYGARQVEIWRCTWE